MSTVPEKFKFRIAALPFWFSLLVILIRGVGATLNLTADCQFNIGDAGSEVTSELTVPDPPHLTSQASPSRRPRSAAHVSRSRR